MVVNSTSLAQELRRRRVGRPALLDCLAGSRRSTWLPCALRETPTPLLMLAAMSIASPAPREGAGPD